MVKAQLRAKRTASIAACGNSVTKPVRAEQLVAARSLTRKHLRDRRQRILHTMADDRSWRYPQMLPKTA